MKRFRVVIWDTAANMDKPVQYAKNFPVRAYLSFRCQLERDLKAGGKLKNPCAEQNVPIQFDPAGTAEGDSLTVFMGDLTAARSAFLFSIPGYFESTYTQVELIRIKGR